MLAETQSERDQAVARAEQADSRCAFAEQDMKQQEAVLRTITATLRTTRASNSANRTHTRNAIAKFETAQRRLDKSKKAETALKVERCTTTFFG